MLRPARRALGKPQQPRPLAFSLCHVCASFCELDCAPRRRRSESPPSAPSSDRLIDSWKPMSSMSPFSESAPAEVESTSEMAEVITLSDDDDVIPLTPPRQPMIPRINVDANQDSSQATVHIGTINKLNLEDLQGPYKKISDVTHRNPAIIHGDSNLARRSGPPPNPIIHRPILEEPRGSRRPTPPTIPNPVPSTSTTQRTRRDQTASGAGTLYKGHYMFEATEGIDQSRRSTRYNTKKIEGKFVCSYNPIQCYKICSNTVELINHAWSHVVHDPPPHINRSNRPPSNAQFEEAFLNGDGSQAILANNSAAILNKMQTCESCNVKFETVFKKQQHYVQCHVNQDSVETVCNICETDFQSVGALTAHMQKHVAGDAPYHCQKCKYRTSVRSFYFQHFVDKHVNDSRMIFCPICLYQEDLKPNTRRTKHIFVRGFFDHMSKHVTTPQHRCRMCALSFNEEDELNHHRQNDHCFLNTLWATSDRPVIHGPTKTRIPRKNKIAMLQKKFMESQEGKRISDEVVKGTEERLGYDTTNIGGTLYECSCGNFKSYNGNRTASHFHRCRRPMKDINREREAGRPERDPEEELKLFSVYPPLSMTEIESQSQQDEITAIRIEKDSHYKVRTDKIKLEAEEDDLIMLKMLASDKDRSTQIIEECYLSLKNKEDE